MPRIPRDISGRDLCSLLGNLGYTVSRQTGSHVRLTCVAPKGRHDITVPDHLAIKIGTLNAILSEVASAHGITKQELVTKLFA